MVEPRIPGITTASSDFAIANRLTKLDGTVELASRRILDIGCNDAAYTVRLAENAGQVVGVDLPGDHLLDAQQRVAAQSANVQLSAMNAEQLGFPSNSFDVVFISEALEHITDQDRALDEIHRVLEEQGLYVLFAPNRYYVVETHGMRIGQRRFGRLVPFVHWLPRFIGRHFTNARSYTPRELKQLLAQHGLTVIHQSFLFPPLDGLRERLMRFNLADVVDSYRRKTQTSSRNPLLRFIGLSIFVVAVKSERVDQSGARV